MIQFFRKFSWTLVLPMVAFGAAHLAHAGDDDIKSVYVIPRKYKGNEADAAQIKDGRVESIEIRFYLREARLRGGLYFQAIHHKLGQPDATLGGTPFKVRNADGSESTKYGLSYDDYQYSTGLLKKDFDAMWGKWIYARNGTSILATGGTIYLMYGIAKYFSKREVLALSFLAGKAIELFKSKIGFAIMIYPSYLAAKEVYNFYNEVQNTGNFIPGWEGFKGREMAERDWLYRVLSQSYENSRYGTPIDDRQFDIDAGYERYHAVLSGRRTDMPAPASAGGEATPAAPAAETVALPAINTVPMKRDLEFALPAMRNFFQKYVEDNAEDELPTQRMPVR